MFTTKMPYSMPWTAPRNWQAVRFNASQEVRCAAGKPLRALRLDLRPRKPVAPVEDTLQAGIASSDGVEFLSFCFRNTSSKDLRPIAQSSQNTLLWNLWLRARETKSHSGQRCSVCDYILAHWTMNVSEPLGCFGENFISKEEPTCH